MDEATELLPTKRLFFLEEYFRNIGQRIADCWDDGWAPEVSAAVRAIEACRDLGGTVYACGNGGSWATAAHFVCDVAKTPQGYAGEPVRAMALGTNPSLLTALANDASYVSIFWRDLAQLHWPDDTGVLVAISASGNSLNVVRAVEWARCRRGLTTVGLTGFDGGRLKDAVDIPIHVPSDHYGVIEDMHMIICHAIAYFLAGGKA